MPEKLDDKVFLKKFAAIVGSEVERIDQIVNQLMEFSKPAPPTPKPTAIHQLIDETLDFLNSQFIHNHIKIQRHYDPHQTHIMIDPNQIRQVLLNLLLNAIDAIHKEGTISIRTYTKHEHTFTISIHDTGEGIPPKIIKNIFDPFITQKNNGTGLGLTISRTIIEEHHGHIKVQSPKNKGTTFIIELPVGKI